MAKAKYEFFIRFEYEDMQMIEQAHILAPRGMNKTNLLRSLIRAGLQTLYPEVFSQVTGLQVHTGAPTDIQGRGPELTLEPRQAQTNIRLGLTDEEREAAEQERSTIKSSPGRKEGFTIEDILRLQNEKPEDRSV